jgi:hypothetical protein
MAPGHHIAGKNKESGASKATSSPDSPEKDTTRREAKPPKKVGSKPNLVSLQVGRQTFQNFSIYPLPYFGL